MILKTLILTFLVLLPTVFSKNLTTRFVVVKIIDGDTIKIIQNKTKKIKCRLAGIDAPEKSQAYGEISKKNLSRLIYKKTVDVSITNIDQYNRSICWIKAQNGLNINLEQVKQGMAWVYRRYTRNKGLYFAEYQAKKERLGLWSDNSPIPPWTYRKQHLK